MNQRVFSGYFIATVMTLAWFGSGPVLAGPGVVAIAEGQIGITPDTGHKIIGSSLESLGGAGKGAEHQVLIGGLFVGNGTLSPPSEFAFITDQLHSPSNPQQVSVFPGTFDSVARVPPSSARSLNTAGNDDFITFSFVSDGSQANTMNVTVATFDGAGQSLSHKTIDNIPTFLPPFPGILPEPVFADTGVSVDKQGRVTVAYTEFTPGSNTPRVKAQRLDASTGQLLGDSLSITDELHANPDIALLDPDGNRLIIVSSDFSDNTIRGNIVNMDGPTPQVLPEFPISTTSGFNNLNPAVAADPDTGVFTVAWENVTANQGDPVNIRARRFDADGNPIGDDFIVNTTTANTQGQPAIAFGPDSKSVIVWAGSGETTEDQLDIFGQVYDVNGQPLGSELRINSKTAGEQSKPVVRFLPEADNQGSTRFVVIWRDVVGNSDETPNGTGIGFRKFAIDDITANGDIFYDSFEKKPINPQ